MTSLMLVFIAYAALIAWIASHTENPASGSV
jgi:hypothetical protein